MLKRICEQVNEAMNIKQGIKASKPIANTENFSEVRAPALCPRLHPEGFLTTITSQRVTTTPEYPTPQSRIQVFLGDQKIINSLLQKPLSLTRTL